MTKSKKNGRPFIFNSAEEINNLVDQYFESLLVPKFYKVKEKDNDGKVIDGKYIFVPELDHNGEHVKAFKEDPCITGLALFLGTTRKTLMQYENLSGDKEELSNAVKMAKAKIEYYTEISNLEPAVKIFKLKNFGWTDKQELEMSGELNIIKVKPPVFED